MAGKAGHLQIKAKEHVTRMKESTIITGVGGVGRGAPNASTWKDVSTWITCKENTCLLQQPYR